MSNADTVRRRDSEVDPRLTTFDFETPVTEWSEPEIHRLLDVLADQDHMAISDPLRRARGDQS